MILISISSYYNYSGKVYTPGYVSETSINFEQSADTITLLKFCMYRECDEQSFYKPVEDPRQCIGQCAETPVCGDHPSIRIPENHLKVYIANEFNLRNLK